MFNPISLELFQGDCRVVYMPSCNQWIYWIQKNGSSSLLMEYRKHNRPIKINDEIKDIDEIHVYIRNPKSRFISGVNTFLQFLVRDNPGIDIDTAIWFIKKYKFLNSHYMPQIYWMLKLSKYITPKTVFCFHDSDELFRVTPYKESPDVLPATPELANKILDNDIEFWFYVDQILHDLKGSSKLSWQQLLDHYQINHPRAWKFLTQNTWPNIKNVLP